MSDADVEAQTSTSNSSIDDKSRQNYLVKSLPLDHILLYLCSSHVLQQIAPPLRGIVSHDTRTSGGRRQAIDLLYGLPDEVFQNWPGVHVFCQCLEKWFKSLMSDDFAIIWRLIRMPMPTNLVEGWHWCLAVIRAFQAQPGEHASIDDVYQQLVADSGLSLPDIEKHEKDRVLLAIFGVLCWTSMTLSPVMDAPPTASPGSNTQAWFRANESRQSQPVHAAERPVAKMFRCFRRQSDRLHPESGGNQDTLYESSLNYYSLATIGRVRLKWVDSLTEHLAFDRHRRVLSVFRFPTFCVSSVLRSKDIQVIQRITQELLPCVSYVEQKQQHDFCSLHREIILSYILLFGQSSAARRLLRDTLLKLKPSCEVDPFLWSLCTKPLFRRLWPFSRGHETPLPSSILPASVVNVDGTLLELEAYSIQDDFPVFGPRLFALQRYNLRQQPSKVRDLWRDRRNPLQWYTFWAVLWVGGVSIIMSILQLAVSSAQLYYGIQQVNWT